MSSAAFDHDLSERTRRPSVTIWVIGLAVVVFLLWSAIAWVAEIVHAPGTVVSSSRPQIINNLEGGILAELNVSEGDIVKPGQVLARLYGTQYQSQVDDLTDQVATLEIRRLRLEAEMLNLADFDVPPEYAARVPDIVASETTLLGARQSDFSSKKEGAEQVLKQANKELEILEKMLAMEVVPLIEVTNARKQQSEAENRLNDVITQMELDRATNYSETLAKLTSLKQQLKIAEDQLRRTVLVAPMKGVVNKLSITTIGGVVRPGEEILQIIPLEDELYIEARVKPEDIAQVRKDQDATIKLTAYDYTIYGTLQGKVDFISADTFKDDRSRNPDGDPHYKVTVKVDLSKLTERQQALEIRPGMLADVELQTGGKTILTYLTKPLYKSQQALRER
ncbi:MULTISPECIES: HlyD family efflux transporter periplasmic adaptor subunit [Gemmobacter]|jgi:adhesin transport system membrane fusion protein|uniref:Adhesin transport system membrane fusion protein n=2 Tax=Gemmobacter TaxID=204456 RepID=A0A2T6AQU8_9RHOB|nr:MULTISPECIES: HlyD family efflux transporter periplasmic adaptor subunit [Gemmobacter]OJY32991.1 MAG: transporter [Rhodobacterales bacterium 65-51]PTX46136.1 adhesin transport system membrane fusion protein [Gemmobacter caeni]TWI94498.1 adhesin transport system membrane fusion protein [Gemmobacter caeni]GHC29451.1 secretion protein HlyD [Gemmobacter nanjingensis]